MVPPSSWHLSFLSGSVGGRCDDCRQWCSRTTGRRSDQRMPGQVPPVADEREGLLAYLAQQRDALRFAAYGLTDEQARATPTVSSLSVGGLIKHVANTERGWMNDVLQ